MFVVTVLFAWVVLGCHGVVYLVGLGCYGIVCLVRFGGFGLSLILGCYYGIVCLVRLGGFGLICLVDFGLPRWCLCGLIGWF